MGGKGKKGKGKGKGKWEDDFEDKGKGKKAKESWMKIGRNPGRGKARRGRVSGIRIGTKGKARRARARAIRGAIGIHGTTAAVTAGTRMNGNRGTTGPTRVEERKARVSGSTEVTPEFGEVLRGFTMPSKRLPEMSMIEPK